jgi:hypothetical protein
MMSNFKCGYFDLVCWNYSHLTPVSGVAQFHLKFDSTLLPLTSQSFIGEGSIGVQVQY